MAISFECGSCGKPYHVDEAMAGKRARCKTCGNEFRVPEPVVTHLAARAGTAADVFGFDEGHSANLPPRSADPELAPVPRAGYRVKKSKSRGNSSGTDIAKVIIFGAIGVLVLAGVLVALRSGSIPGLGAESRYERFVKEAIASFDEMSNVLDTVQDVTTARMAAPRVQALAAKFGDFQRQYETLPKPSQWEDSVLDIKYRTQVQASVDRMKKSIERVQGIPGAMEVLHGSFATMSGFRFTPPPPPRMPGPPSAPGFNPPPAGPGFSPPPTAPRFNPPPGPRPGMGPRFGPRRGGTRL
jgi:DNA-directed RNA polymerase subunit RPC12/RpoP